VTSFLVLATIAFVQVFALGFQSRNVNHGNYGWAAGTSFFIGISQAAVWRRVASPTADWREALIYAVAGAVAIVCSMWIHERFIGRKPN
jgi:hypothetical protein